LRWQHETGLATAAATEGVAALEAEVSRFVDSAFADFDANHDGLLQRDEYSAACATHPFMLAMFKARVESLYMMLLLNACDRRR
jgi:hypothetical protein